MTEDEFHSDMHEALEAQKKKKKQIWLVGQESKYASPQPLVLPDSPLLNGICAHFEKLVNLIKPLLENQVKTILCHTNPQHYPSTHLIHFSNPFNRAR